METPKTDALITDVTLDQVIEIIDLSRFEELCKKLGATNLDTEKTHNEVISCLEVTIKKYRESVLNEMEKEQGDLDEKHMNIIQAYTDVITEKFKDTNSGEAEIRLRVLRALNLILFETKNIVEDTINKWIKFYVKEFWIMLELGIEEFATMNMYVSEDLCKHNNKVNSSCKKLSGYFRDFIGSISRKTGERIIGVGFQFKKRAHDALAIMNEGSKHCSAVTPLVGKYELERLKIRIENVSKQLKRTWFMDTYANQELVETFFKSLFDNVEMNPVLKFDHRDQSDKIYHPGSRSISNKVKPVELSDDEETEDTPTHKDIKGHSTNAILRQKTDVEDEVDENGNLKLGVLNQQDLNECTSNEEKDINTFLSKHKDIEEKRKQKMRERYQELMKKDVEDVKYYVNKEGHLAKYVKFKGEDKYILIRKDEKGENVVTEQVNNDWFQIDKSYVQSGKGAYDIITSKPIQIDITAAEMSGALFMSGSGALGSFLYRMIEGKEEMSTLSKDLARDAGTSVALTVLVTTVPFVAISVASVLGVKTLNDLRKNEFIKTNKKFYIVSDILARAGTKTACAVGGALAGQALIPVPFLGAFIGGVVGGFTGSALVSSYDSLIAKRVSLELFCIYCMIELKDKHEWTGRVITKPDLKHHEKDIETFLGIIDGLTTKKFNTSQLSEDFLKKESDARDIMDEIYASIAAKGDTDQIGKSFEKKWKSLIAYCFISYYYFLLFNQLDELIEREKITEEDKVKKLDTFEKQLDLQNVINWLAPKIGIFSPNRPLDKMIVVINQMIKNYKIVTLFEPLKKTDKDKKEESSSQKKKQETEKAHNSKQESTKVQPKKEIHKEKVKDMDEEESEDILSRGTPVM